MSAHDLVFHGGSVITLDAESRVTEALALKAGQVSGAGSEREVLADAGPGTRTVDLAGATVIPGLFDAHAHMDRTGLKARGGVDLSGVTSIDGITRVVAEAVTRTPAGEWIVLMPLGTPPFGYVHRPEQIEEGRFPERKDLDAVAPGHPVYIRAPWGWWSRAPFPSIANSAALDLAGITAETVAPYRTAIEIGDDGRPTGVFLDYNYAPIMEYTLFQCVPRFAYEDRVTGVRLGSRAYSAAGTTSVYEGHGLTPAVIDAYRAIHRHGELSVRLVAPLSVPTASFADAQIRHVLDEAARDYAEPGSGDELLHLEGITLDVGDAEVARIIGRGYPYEQWAGHYYQSVPHERFVELGVAAARLGLRMNCVVCYDLERVLSAYEAINEQVRIVDRRWVLMHVIAADDAQIRRMRDLGIIATVTPNFMYMANDRFGLDELGPRGIPIRRLIDGGVPVALSSDNMPHSMLWTMWEALARWDGDTERQLGASGLSREEALRISCQTGHQLTRDEHRRGSLEVGKQADLVLLAEDPLTCDLDRLKDIPVRATYIGGREVYRHPQYT